jgi:transposase
MKRNKSMQGKKQYSEKLFNYFQLSERIPKENFYRKLNETLELKFLYQATAHLYGDTGNPSIDPVVFFKLMLVSYLENITSDRRLIDHCSLRMDILYFLNYDIDEELPWHSTVSRTRQLYDNKLFEELFSKVFSLCAESGMVAGHTQAIDSAYIKANASMDSIEQKQPSQSVNEFISKSAEENHVPLRKAKENKADEEQKTITSNQKELNELATRNKRFEEKKIEAFGNKITFTSYSNQTHYSPTDPDARIATKPGKPRQLNYMCSMAADTDQGVISHVQADYADKKDSRYLNDITLKTKQELEENNLTIQNILTDTGYSSGKNYHLLEQQGLTPYIPVSGVYKHEREGFTYNKEQDHFVCRNGKLLRFKKIYTDESKDRIVRHYRSTRKDCKDCPFKKECIGTKAQEKKFEISFYQQEYERAWNRQQTKHFQRMVKLRAGTIEPVFGNLINYYGMRKINVKGIKGAHKVMLMAATAYNLRKWMKFMSKKANVKVQELQGKALRLYKTVSYDFTRLLRAHANFSIPAIPLKIN